MQEKNSSLEAGRAWKFSVNEVQRSAETFKFGAEEAKRLHGEAISVEASCFGKNQAGSASSGQPLALSVQLPLLAFRESGCL